VRVGNGSRQLALLILSALYFGCSLPAGENIAYVPPDPPIISLPVSAANDTVGNPISYPSVSSGGPISSYSILPPLPAGVTLNTVTGIIGGTPTAGCAPTLHILTAKGPAGAIDTARITLRIAYRPFTISYPEAAVDTVDDSLSYAAIPDTTLYSPVRRYSIAPALPAGLRLDTLTGRIYGRPTQAAPSTVRVVTGTGPGGDSDTARIVLEIVHRPPVISYAPAFESADFVDTQYQEVSHSVISLGGRVTVFRIAPALPEGLNFDSLTGQIWGSPVSEFPNTLYTVGAEGPAGNAITVFILTVVQNPSLPPNATGVSVSLNLGFASGIPLSRMVFTFTSSDPLDSVVRDTVTAEEEGFAGNPGAAQSFAKLHALKPLRNWFMEVKTLDANDSVIHAGFDTVDALLPGEVRASSLSLPARYLAYTAQFQLPTNANNFIVDLNNPLQFNRFAFVIAGDTVRDTVAAGGGFFPTSGTRSFGTRYVPADKIDQLELMLFGTATGWSPTWPLLQSNVWLGGSAYVPGTIVYSPPLVYTGPGSTSDPGLP
jgi:hypothetical protein